MSPRQPMRAHNIRMPDKTWEAAMQESIERGENLSEEIRKFLEQYAEKGATVWIVRQDEYDDYEIHGVFATEDLAREFAKGLHRGVVGEHVVRTK